MKLNAEPERTVDITLVPANQGDTSNDDYSGVPASLTFNSGETEKTFRFTATQDSVDDDGESVELGFGDTLPAGVTLGTHAEAIVSITDDDAPSSLTVNFEASTYNVTEGGTVEIVLTLDDDPERTVTVPLSKTNKDGASDSDYVGVPTSVIFNAGEISKSFMFSAVSDRIGDPGEKVSFKLENLPSGTTAGTTGETVVTIEDVAPQGSTTVSFGADTYGVSEGLSTTITVVMSPAPGSDAIILIATEGRNGATPADYSVVPASVTFGPTDTSKTFTFEAADDAEDDDGETVKLTFVNLPAGVSAGSVPETTVSIIDDDVPAVEVSFGSAMYSATEGGLDAVVTVQLSSPAPHRVEIPITAAGMNGASDDDWTGVPEELIFASGEQSKTFTVMAYDDTVEDDGETVDLGFGALPAGFVAGNPSAATVELMNMEHTSQDCGTAIWCATVTLAGYENNINGGGDYSEKLANSSLIGNNYFTYNGTTYHVPVIYSVLQHHYFYLSRFVIKLRPYDAVDENGTADDYTNWTLYVDGEAFPFTQDRMVGGGFRWRHPNFYDFRPGTTFDLRIEETANSQARAIDEAPPAPMYLTVFEDDSYLSVDWERPPMDEGQDVLFYNETSVPEVTRYRVELKKAGNKYKWASARSESISYPSSRSGLVNLSNGVEYTLRVFAINQYGESPPSPEVTGTPHEMTPPGLLTATVDGSTLTLTYDEVLDGTAVPAMDTFTVSVDGSDRVVQSVSIEGSQVKLTLASSVGEGDSVALSYKKPLYMERPRIQDSVGNAASSIRNKTVTSAPAEAVGTRANSPATGAPVITGIPRVGEMLTADTSSIEDDDGLEKVSYSYQWIRNDGTDDTDIAGATGSTYIMASGDEGKAIKVRVTFTDDAGNEQFLTSAAVAAPVSRSDRLPAAPGTPIVSPEDTGALTVSWKMAPDGGGPPITGYLVQWKEADDRWETAADVSEATVTGTTHTITGLTDGVEYAIRVVANSGADNSPASEEAFGTPRETTPPEFSAAIADGATLTLTYDEALDENSVPGADTFTVMAGSEERGIARVSVAGAAVILILDSAVVSEDEVTVSYAAPADESAIRIRDAAANHAASFDNQAVTNNTATGQPTVTGTARVGEILTADTTGITDADGLDNVSYSYQWVANDGGTDADISGETDATYTLVADDEGKTIKVRVTIIDDAGNEATLTSAATEAVGFAVQQQGASNTPTTGEPTITGAAQVGEMLTADTSGIADDDGLVNATFSYQWVANDGTSDTDIFGAADNTYTLVDDDEGQTIKVRVIVTDDAENETTLTSEATDSVEAAPQPDSPATGEPTISGTAQVGEMLTADTSSIADDDGLVNATFSYQWLGDDTDIAGATSSTYTLAETDEGQTIKVRVIVTDDAENETTLTSEATAVVAAPEPPAMPTGLSAAAISHDAVTLTWDDPQDDAITGYVILRRDREIHPVGTFVTIAGDTGSADTTYTDATVEPEKQYNYKIQAINEHGEVSEKSDWVRANTPTAPPADSPATGEPTISGTAQVGQTLTADTSGIADADGLTNVSYRYQWVVTDGGAYIDISGETGATYTLVSVDRGLHILVRVSFTDDAGKRERLTSAATDVVAAEA